MKLLLLAAVCGLAAAGPHRGCNVISIDHNHGWRSKGKYPHFSTTCWMSAMGMRRPWGGTLYRTVTQVRSNTAIWSGRMAMWATPNSPRYGTRYNGIAHARRAYGAGAGQWRVQDRLFGSGNDAISYILARAPQDKKGQGCIVRSITHNHGRRWNGKYPHFSTACWMAAVGKSRPWSGTLYHTVTQVRGTSAIWTGRMAMWPTPNSPTYGTRFNGIAHARRAYGSWSNQWRVQDRLFASQAAASAYLRPTTVGCWHRLPSGCPRQRHSAPKWTRDTWGEQNRLTLYSKARCEQRRHDYNHWCGVSNAQIHWVGAKIVIPAKPKTEGCWHLLPTGCNNHLGHRAFKWTRDTWGEQNRDALYNGRACAQRKHDHNSWCGQKDARVHWISPPIPTAVGCWHRLPSGCPKQSHKAPRWIKDQWGMDHRLAHYSAARCEQRRKDYNSWCGVSNAQVLYRPAKSVYPAKPRSYGCWHLLPRGCHNHLGHRAFKWTRDTWGEQNRDALYNGRACAQRRLDYNSWCGVKNAVVHFVRPAIPTAVGCWHRLPSGCPKHAGHKAELWTKDQWGMDHRLAHYSKARCEQRRHDYNSWCGVSNAKVLFRGAKIVIPPVPKSVGCWHLLPTGCTNHIGHRAFTWTRDTWGEKHRNALTNKAACLQRRKDYNGWCGPNTNTRIWWYGVSQCPTQDVSPRACAKKIGAAPKLCKDKKGYWFHHCRGSCNLHARTSCLNVGKEKCADQLGRQRCARRLANHKKMCHVKSPMFWRARCRGTCDLEGALPCTPVLKCANGQKTDLQCQHKIHQDKSICTRRYYHGSMGLNWWGKQCRGTCDRLGLAACH